MFLLNRPQHALYTAIPIMVRYSMLKVTVMDPAVDEI